MNVFTISVIEIKREIKIFHPCDLYAANANFIPTRLTVESIWAILIKVSIHSVFIKDFYVNYDLSFYLNL